jgi:hypothetical protein
MVEFFQCLSALELARETIPLIPSICTDAR